jgi:hypothetical protein
LGNKNESQPHSATRFVLPFKVRAAAGRKAGDGGAIPGATHYEEVLGKAEGGQEHPGAWICANLAARERYLLRETRTVLFDRASWWVMKCEPAEIKMPTLDGKKTITGTVRPPAVVLFERESKEPLLCCGFLIVEVALTQDCRFDDLLLFNELFRYWREPYSVPRAHSAEFKAQLESFLAPFKTLTGNDQRTDPYGGRWLSLLGVPLGGRLLVGPTDRDSAAVADEVFGGYADDRAFVWTRALMKDADLGTVIPHEFVMPESGKTEWQSRKDDATGFCEMFGYWVKLLNVDKPATEWRETNVTTRFEKEWAGDRTYRRWEEDKCFYGFNNFSGAMLSTPRKNPPAGKGKEKEKEKGKGVSH